MAKSKKENFIKVISEIFEEDCYCENWMSKDPTAWEDAVDYFNALKVVEDKDTKKFTDNGKIILKFMQENIESYSNMFKAKDFEAAGITSRTASGAIRKLVTDGYCDKAGQNPVVYMLTSTGKEVTFEEE